MPTSPPASAKNREKGRGLRTGDKRVKGPEGSASERGVAPQGTARRAAAERSLKTGTQRSQPDSQLQGASRLEDVSTGARTATIIFKAREQGNWVDTYKMDINPSEPSDRSMVERMAKKDARNRLATFYDKDLKPIAPVQCCDAAIEDGTDTIFMVFCGELNLDAESWRCVQFSHARERRRKAASRMSQIAG
ncbi:hypothetical protein CIHG_09637 [Coccidioides immitis H538.4]|uniref:Uncharacterized protein n=1 Tax=Coccidioides immitis H538.4 TaxID=396776 RepID=A0A0J8S5Z1_COCIT|nr:hypothetical protein CIHG_09637 [Coccidioides immitis H538.4]